LRRDNCSGRKDEIERICSMYLRRFSDIIVWSKSQVNDEYSLLRILGSFFYQGTFENASGTARGLNQSSVIAFWTWSLSHTFTKLTFLCWMVRCSGGVEGPKGFLITWLGTIWFSYVWDGLIFCRYATARPWSTTLGPVRAVNLLAPKWSRFAAQWRADLLILRSRRGVKHLRHGRTEMADGPSTHGMAEPEMTEQGELWVGLSNIRGDGHLGPQVAR
jgi:hypothetical protein